MSFDDLKLATLDEALSRFSTLKSVSRPRFGWARAVREALGMTRSQLASRVGLAGPTVATLERSEARGSITLESLDRLAHGMGCRVVYAIVPAEGPTLEKIVRDRAESVARERLSRVSHSMNLENQGVGAKSQRRQLARLVATLLAGSRRNLWR